MHALLTAALAILAAWLAWRCRRLSRGLGELDRQLRNPGGPDPSHPSFREASGVLARIARGILDHATEHQMARGLETARRRDLEALLDAIDDALLVVDERGEVRFSNRAARDLYPSGHSHVGRTLLEVSLDHRVADSARFAVETGERNRDRFNRTTPGDPEGRSERVYVVETEPLASLGIGPGASVLIRDVTLALETEQIRRDFVANASHELRTPLSIIAGYLEMLDPQEHEAPLQPAVLERCIPVMRKHSQRLSRILDDMLSISKLESGEGLHQRERFDLSDIIRDSLDHLQPLIEQQRAKIHLDLPLQAPMIGDRLSWDQVFFNLLENALKQNPAPGLRLAVKLAAMESDYRVEVTDNGVGIPAADLPHVFKRFYRVQKDHSQAVKGTGLGLSIVKRAVEAHGGAIRAHSRPGRETAFLITVPRPAAEELQQSLRVVAP